MAAPTATRGTLAHFATGRWRDLNKRCVNGSCPQWGHKGVESYLREGIRLEMTRVEFFAWCEAKWPEIEAMYVAGVTPSLGPN